MNATVRLDPPQAVTRRALITGLSLTLALTSAAGAQQSVTATVTATATVNAAITVTSTRTLSFGSVTQNEAKTISAAVPGAGQLVFTGAPSSPASVAFLTIPTTLLGPGGATLRIDGFSGFFNGANTTAGGTAFTPSTAAQAAGVSSTTGQLYIFFGATVHPAIDQPTGPYSATVVLQVAY